MAKLEEILVKTGPADPQTAELLSRLKLLYQKRFWFEFTEVLSQLIYQRPSFDSREIIEATIEELSVYNDPVFVVELVDVYLSRWAPATVEGQLKLINRAREIFSRNDMAQQFLNLLEAKVHLVHNNFEEGLRIHQASEEALEAMREVPKVVYAALQETKAIYFWKKGDYDSYFQAAQNWLAYVDEKKLGAEQKQTLAENVLEAGLVNNATLGLGNLLENPLFAALKTDPARAPLLKVVDIFGKGNVEEFENFVRQSGDSLRKFQLVGNNIDKLRRKIRVIAFYDSVFFNNKRNFEPMSLSFQEISQIAQVGLNEVEKMIVYVLSIGIFQGYVDELQQKFFITRMKPQELDPVRIGQLKENFDQWRQGIQKTIEFINKC
jgi:hypothetical protein